MRVIENYRELKLSMKALESFLIIGDNEEDFMALSGLRARLIALEERVPSVYRNQPEYADHIEFVYSVDQMKERLDAYVRSRQELTVICLNMHRMNAWVEEMRKNAITLINKSRKSLEFENGLKMHFLSQGLALMLQGEKLGVKSRVIVEAF